MFGRAQVGTVITTRVADGRPGPDPAEDGVQKVLYKLLGVLSGVLAAKAARSFLDKGWARTRGGEPPRNPATPGVGWGDALAWAVASGVAAGVARMLATKGTASAWKKSTGHLPPGLEEVGN